MLMTIHKRTPWMRGLIPTVRSTSVEREAPIKNIVSVRQRRAMPEITAPKAGMLSRRNVFKTIAMMK